MFCVNLKIVLTFLNIFFLGDDLAEPSLRELLMSLLALMSLLQLMSLLTLISLLSVSRLDSVSASRARFFNALSFFFFGETAFF